MLMIVENPDTIEETSKNALAVDAGSGVPEFDAEEFHEYVDDFDITEEQKTELLKALWSIAIACVDLGFGVDSLHLAIPALAEFSSTEESDALEKDVHVREFNSAASDAQKG